MQRLRNAIGQLQGKLQRRVQGLKQLEGLVEAGSKKAKTAKEKAILHAEVELQQSFQSELAELQPVQITGLILELICHQHGAASAAWKGKTEEEAAVVVQMVAEASAASNAEAAAASEAQAALATAEATSAESEAISGANLTARRLQSLSQTLQGQTITRPGLKNLSEKLATTSEDLSQQVEACMEARQRFGKIEEEEIEATELAKTSEATSLELQEQVRLLVLASSAACELRNAEASLGQGEEELERISGQLNVKAASCKELFEQRCLAESRAEAEELLLSQLQSESQGLDSRLQRAEARQQTQERRCRQERAEWKQQLRQHQLHGVNARKSIGNFATEPLAVVYEAVPDHTAQEAWECNGLVQEKNALEEQAKELQIQLEATRRRHHTLVKENDTERYLAKRGEEVLAKEIASARGRVTAMSYELDRLLQVTAGPDASNDRICTSFSGQANRASESDTAKQAFRAFKGRSKKLQASLAQEQEQGRQLRDRVSQLKHVNVQLRERIRDAEQRLHVSRDDVERKRVLAATLQKRRQESAEQTALATQQEEESSRSLQQLRSDAARKDAAIKNLQNEIASAQRETNQASGKDRGQQEEARSKMQVELHRKEQLLHDARAKAQLLKTRLDAEVRRDVRARRVARSVSSSRLERSPETGSDDLAESPLPPSGAERAREPVCSLECLRSSGFSAVEELSGIIFQAANSADSSWELSTAVQESLQILNLQQEDLAEFLPPTET
ncbi:unnamed protein product, partial [Symbiodinium necroappetens]